MQETIKLIYEDSDLLAFYKPKGLPTVPLKDKKGETLLSIVADRYPEILSPHGKNPWEGSILHRLDTPTSGIVLAPRNRDTFITLSMLQDQDKIKKTYIAEVSEKRKPLEGFEVFPYDNEKERVDVVSSFRSFGPKGASVRPLLQKRKGDERLYKTSIQFLGDNKVKCEITRGFRHQIRCHLSWMGRPIVGDDRYGGKENDFLLLEAVSVSFPFNGKELEIKI